MSYVQHLHVTVGGVIVGVSVLGAAITPIVLTDVRGTWVITGLLSASATTNTVSLAVQMHRHRRIQLLRAGIQNLTVVVINSHALQGVVVGAGLAIRLPGACHQTVVPQCAR